MIKKFYNFANSWTGTIIIVLLVIFFVVQAFVIPSGSMKRSMLIGDHLFVKKFAYGIPTPHIPWLEVPVLPDFNGNGHLFEGERPKRGDIVVFRYPLNEKTHFVKRCVAVGGDMITIKDKVLYLKPHEGNEYVKANYPQESIIDMGGTLWVKNPYMHQFPGIQIDENVTQGALYPEQIFNYPPVQIDEDFYFMMGDNRDHSNDSRFWGPVPYRLVEGTPWFIYFSWDKNYEIRWDRIGKTVDTVVNNAEYINPKEPLD
ncbi:MAG: signal peptidase I [Epsilonproteobacteria bacterium]|nr:signal peptidase I [Campylobacterota bacterium]